MNETLKSLVSEIAADAGRAVAEALSDATFRAAVIGLVEGAYDDIMSLPTIPPAVKVLAPFGRKMLSAVLVAACERIVAKGGDPA